MSELADCPLCGMAVTNAMSSWRGHLFTYHGDDGGASAGADPEPRTEAVERLALQEVVDQLDDYGPNGPGFARAIEHARAVLAIEAEARAQTVTTFDQRHQEWMQDPEYRAAYEAKSKELASAGADPEPRNYHADMLRESLGAIYENGETLDFRRLTRLTEYLDAALDEAAFEARAQGGPSPIAQQRCLNVYEGDDKTAQCWLYGAHVGPHWYGAQGGPSLDVERLAQRLLEGQERQGGPVPLRDENEARAYAAWLLGASDEEAAARLGVAPEPPE